MNNFRKWMIVLLSVLIAVLCGSALAACDTGKSYRKPKDGITEDGRYDPNNKGGDLSFYLPYGSDTGNYDGDMYTIYTSSLGGLPISGVRVTVSRDGATLVVGRSNSNGIVKFGLPFDNYDLSYGDLPNGYSEDEEHTVYRLTTESREVKTAFKSEVIKSTVPSSHIYQKGDVMYDFSFKDADGVEIRLSDLLQEKRLVLLNFWYTTCNPCALEFPLIENIYNEYIDQAMVVALSNQDSSSAVKTYKENGYAKTDVMGQVVRTPYTFFMGTDNAGLTNRFGVNVFPTNVFIDRYGVIAYADVGSITSPQEWNKLFSTFCADDYEQSTNPFDDETPDIEQTPSDPIPPSEDADFTLNNVSFTQALLHESMVQGGKNEYDELPLQFRYPDPSIESEARDAKYSWPYIIKEDKDGMYLSPSNVGIDNTYAIIYTHIVLATDDILSIEFNLNTEENNDQLYIIINNSIETTYVESGDTNGWQELTLYEATRPTLINIAILYYKSLKYSLEDEFVGVRNLKITPLDTNTEHPIDVRTEAAVEKDGVMTYASIYRKDDGYYHVSTQAGVQSDNDPILFADVYYKTLWSDRHLANFTFEPDGSAVRKGVYWLSYWLFNKYLTSEGSQTEFDYGAEESDTIIDGFYIQDGSDALVPVTDKVITALKAFTRHVVNYGETKNAYEHEFDPEYTWLELCSYYRTLGGSHTVEDHLCLATNNSAEGRVVEFAIPLTEGTYRIKSIESTRRNQGGGLFYKFTASKEGVYSFRSEILKGHDVDPKIYLWESETSAYYGNIYPPLVEMDDTLSVERFRNSTTNFDALIYLKAGQTIYPQLSTTTSMDVYDVIITYMGEEHWAFETATTAEGTWTWVMDNDAEKFVYGSIKSVYVGGGEDAYYHLTDDNELGSVIYIDFLMRNFIDANGHTLEEFIDRGYFNFTESGGSDKTTIMRKYCSDAKAKDPSDPTYGMVVANSELVNTICQFTRTQLDEGDTVESGIWKAFAFYYHYYGATNWKELPN